jgi:hypothetical protein
MNQTVIATALFAVLAGSTTAVAQSPAPSEGSTATAATTPQRETKGSIRPARESATDADARLCLEFPTNAQVVVCAEKYRPGRRRT